MPLKILDRIRAVFLFLVAVAHPTLSQTFIFDTYNVGHGLPSNWITTICQDPKGYLWVGGDGGIAVYNGVAFTAYGAGDGLTVPMIWKLTASLTSPGTVHIGTCFSSSSTSADTRHS